MRNWDQLTTTEQQKVLKDMVDTEVYREVSAIAEVLEDSTCQDCGNSNLLIDRGALTKYVKSRPALMDNFKTKALEQAQTQVYVSSNDKYYRL